MTYYIEQLRIYRPIYFTLIVFYIKLIDFFVLHKHRFNTLILISEHFDGVSQEAAVILTSYLALFKKEQIVKTFKRKIKNTEQNPRPNFEPDIEFRIPSNG